MKGLIRNNMYHIMPTLKMVALIFVLFQVGIAFLIMGTHVDISIIEVALGASMGSFSSIAFSLLFNLSKSKWDNYELTTTVNRKDVMTARYLTFLILFILAIILLFVSISVIKLSVGVDYSSSFPLYAIVVLLLILAPSIMHVGILKFGIERGQLIYIISVVLSAAIYVVPVRWIEVPKYYTTIFTIVSFILFFISYLISVKMYSKKEL